MNTKIYTLDFTFGQYPVRGISEKTASKKAFEIAIRNLEPGESCDCIFRNKDGDRVSKDFIRV